jgi:hypothetical protein
VEEPLRFWMILLIVVLLVLAVILKIIDMRDRG